MASIVGTAILSSVRPPRQSLQVSNGLSSLKAVSFFTQRKNMSIRLHPVRSGVRVSCVAKPETVERVCGIVKKQLALSDATSITGESTFAQLGADSLDTVEVVMGLEEEFDINVEEESAQNIQTVQDAANLIEKLVQKKRSAA